MTEKESKNNLEFIKNLTRLGLYISLALATFIVFVIIVLSIGSSNSNQIIMQDLSGKYFSDVHNDLVQSQIRIQLIQKSYPDQLPGIILHQSIPAGSRVSSREKLYLTVNQPVPILAMPSLVGSSLASAKATVERIPSTTNKVYSIEIALISRVPSGEFPPNTVLSQFPPAKSSITPFDKIYLLVTASDDKPEEYPDLSLLKGQNIKIASEAMSRLNLDYRMQIVEKEHGTENGQVKDVVKNSDGSVQLQVFYTKQDYRYKNGYEKLSLELDGQGRCEVIQTSDSSQDRERVYMTLKHKESEPVELLFYREGSAHFEVFCGDERIYSKEFAPDDLS